MSAVGCAWGASGSNVNNSVFDSGQAGELNPNMALCRRNYGWLSLGCPLGCITSCNQDEASEACREGLCFRLAFRLVRCLTRFFSRWPPARWHFKTICQGHSILNHAVYWYILTETKQYEEKINRYIIHKLHRTCMTNFRLWNFVLRKYRNPPPSSALIWRALQLSRNSRYVCVDCVDDQYHILNEIAILKT